MLVYATINPAPSVCGRILRVRHVGASIEAPGGVCLRAYWPTIAEEGPNVLGAIRVSWMVLLCYGLTCNPQTSLQGAGGKLRDRSRSDKLTLYVESMRENIVLGSPSTMNAR